MMELSYIDKQDITLYKIDVLEFAMLVQEMTKRLLKEKEICLTVQTEGGNLWGDPDLLLSLFSNLIDNARKACPKRGTIILTGKKMQEGYFFCLTDNGMGMPEEEIYKITEPFYMIDKSRARKEGGAGMGMALCQKIIRLHHAEWDIISSPGKGTRIEIQFPAQSIANAEKSIVQEKEAAIDEKKQ